VTRAHWTVVVPVKSGDSAKSRLAADPRRADIARALALDTLDAVLASDRVAEVVVVTDARIPLADRRLHVVRDPGAGLRAALAHGLTAARRRGGYRALLLGDLPLLSGTALDSALDAAEPLPRALVADAEGTGSTLTTAAPGVAHRIRFGRDSRRLHRASGYVELALPRDSVLRRDADVPSDLDLLSDPRLGRRTRTALRARPSTSSGTESSGR
jgi:2-phospho-L-lactate/phosphoenolpyruvate guanylyltransferase